MELIDGLYHYKSDNIFYPWSLRLEDEGQHILDLIKRYNNNPPESALIEIRLFLINVEKWKAGCLKQRTGNASRNIDLKIWKSIFEATKSYSDIDMLLAIMQLRGFGSSYDDDTGQRRAKVATSVLRFLWPEKWGVVDWRTATILGFLKKTNWDIDWALGEAKENNPKNFRGDFEIINEKGAVEYNRQYRDISKQNPLILPRAADVDMAIFGLSLLAWPM